MKAEEFNEKYGFNFSYSGYLATGFRTAAQNVTITRTDERMPTPRQEVKVRVNPSQALYIRYLRSYLITTAKFLPIAGGGLAEITKDFESVLAEENPIRKAYEEIPPEFIRELQKEALAYLPKDAVDLRQNVIENGAHSKKVSQAAYAKEYVADCLKQRDVKKAVVTLKALEKTHAERGWKFGNLFTNIREWWTIRSIRSDIEKAAGGRESFEKAYAQQPETFDLEDGQKQEIEKACNERIAEREEGNREPLRENVHVAEAEESVSERSEKAEEIQPLSPQKELL